MKLLILGYTLSGKSTTAAILAEILNTKYADTSAKLIEEFAASRGLTINYIRENKNQFRADLFAFGRARQAIDPLWPQDVQINDFDILTGLRNPNEIEAARTANLYNPIIWIDRPGVTAGPTDKLCPSDADVIVHNNGAISDLRSKLEQLVREFRVTHPDMQSRLD